MNISIFASIGAQNLGDELILKNEIELLTQEFSTDTKGIPVPVEFRVASYCPQNPVFQISNTQYFEYFPIGIKNPKNIPRNIKNFLKFIRVIIWSDIVVIGGGGIIYDSEIQSVNSPLNQWIFRSRIARFFRKKLSFYAVGIDIKQEKNYKKLEKIFKKAWKITVRDTKSQEQLQKLGIRSEIVDDPVMCEGTQTGDIITSLSSTIFSLKDFEDIDVSGKKIGLALRQGYIGRSGHPKIENKLIEELCQFIEKKGGKIIFLPHSLHDTDIRANDYEFMKQFLNYEREIYASLGEVYTAYTHHMVDMIISMRLHSVILSYVYGIPQIALSYSQKTDEILKKLSQ